MAQAGVLVEDPGQPPDNARSAMFDEQMKYNKKQKQEPKSLVSLSAEKYVEGTNVDMTAHASVATDQRIRDAINNAVRANFTSVTEFADQVLGRFLVDGFELNTEQIMRLLVHPTQAYASRSEGIDVNRLLFVSIKKHFQQRAQDDANKLRKMANITYNNNDLKESLTQLDSILAEE